MRRDKKIYLSIIFVVLIWLVCANHIVANLFVDESNRLKKINLENVEKQDLVFAGITKGTDSGDIFDRYSMTGMAFCAMKPGTTNTNRKINLILKSDKVAYGIEAVSAPRTDLYEEYYESIPLYNGSLGFSAVFSTINIPNGIYEVALQVVENEVNFGFSETGCQYIKDNQGFRPYKGEVKLSSDTENVGEGCFWADSLTLKKGVLDFSGWQSMDESASQAVYLQITNEKGALMTFKLSRNIRADVADFLQNDAHLISGISGTYENVNLTDGEYEVRIIIQSQDQYYVSSDFEKFRVASGTITEREHFGGL